jgi:hypothetical protein
VLPLIPDVSYRLKNLTWIFRKGIIVIGDIIGDIIGDLIFGSDPSKRSQALVRVLFGSMGVVLSAAGMVKVISYEAGLAFRLAGMFMFAMLICFCGFNIVLLTKWKWPGRLFLLSLPLLFAVRIIFGP